jgi:hypothetical protein
MIIEIGKVSQETRGVGKHYEVGASQGPNL